MFSSSALVVLVFLSASVQGRTTLRKDDLSTMIVGGTTARQGQFPYQLEILEGSDHLCGASLVQVSGIQIAITADHCLNERNIINYTLIAGELDRNEISGFEQYRNVSGIIGHPDRGPWITYSDISIMFFTPPFQLNDNVKSISLPSQFEELALGSNVTVSGWGRLSYGGIYPNLLQYVEIPVVSNSQCNDTWGEIVDSQLCTGDINGIASPCHGDSGGPAVSESMTLAGIVSYGKECSNTDTNPAVFTKVSHFVDWIEKTVEDYKNFVLRN